MASKTFTAVLLMSVGKKIIMALTGLFLVLFVIIHMLGNLTFLAGPEAFNSYSHKLTSLGPLLYFIEIVLLAAFVFHAYFAISISIDNRKARPLKYRKLESAGKPSKKTISSTSMIYTGLVLLLFTIIHLKTFKYGPYYEIEVNGVAMRDLYTLVAETFQNPLYAFGYAIVMFLLGYHLRHGFWSAFQSLGTIYPRYSAVIYSTGALLAVTLALGFVVLPLLVFFAY